jgi:carboxylesterase
MRGAEPIFIDKNSKIGILMLHGFTSTPYQFKDLSQYLAQKGFTVYAPLIAGHGTDPEDLIKTSPKEWCQSVKDAFLKLKEKSEKVFILGNSFGGNLAFWLAKEMNGSIAGIISLGAPVKLRYHWFLVLRYRLYGRFRKYYHKPPRVYKTDYTDMVDEVTYPVIPIKSLGEFFDFLANETIPNLEKVKAPVLVAHANVDPVSHPKSATYIYEHLGSNFKKIYWFESRKHILTSGDCCYDLFEKIYKFIQEVIQNNHG